jgi:hypothetical protein
MLAEVLRRRFCLRLWWQGANPKGHAASKLLDEFLFSQSSHCWALLTKDAGERVRNAVSHRVDVLLKVDEFLLNLK